MSLSDDELNGYADELIGLLGDAPQNENPDDLVTAGEIKDLVEKLKTTKPEILMEASKVFQSEKKERQVIGVGVCGLCRESFPRKTAAARFCSPDHKLLAHYERRLIEMGRVSRNPGMGDPYCGTN